MYQREKVLKNYITRAVVIGKPIDQGTITLETVMRDTFHLEKPIKSSIESNSKKFNLLDNV